MSDGLPYADIVILALIAGFILLRLRGVLGQKIGHDKPREYKDLSGKREDSPIVQLGDKLEEEEREKELQEDEKLVSDLEIDEVKEGISAIKAADRDFTLRSFLEGAQQAFEMVFEAFKKNDRDTLTMLLAPELKKMFIRELEKIEKQEAHTETTLVSINSAEVVKATLHRNTARITVRFVSEQISVERNKDGEIVKGDPAQTEFVEDEWTFERSISSRNPNWKIIDT